MTHKELVLGGVEGERQDLDCLIVKGCFLGDDGEEREGRVAWGWADADSGRLIDGEVKGPVVG